MASEVANVDVPDRILNATVDSSTSPVKVADPAWRPEPMVTAQNIQALAKEPTQLLPANYPSLSPIERIETIKETKKQIIDDGQKLIEEASSIKEKEKRQKELEAIISGLDQKQKLAATEKVEAPLSSSAPAPAQAIPVAVSAMGGLAAPSTAGQPRNYQVPKSTMTESEKSFNQALLKTKYAQDRTPLSVSPINDVSVSTKTATSEQLQGTSVIPPIRLTLVEYQKAISSIEYVQVVEAKTLEALKAYEKTHGPQSNVTLRLYCDENKERPLVINVTRNAQGKVTIQRVVEPVISRNSKLKDLVLTISEETKH
jgi:hypothetical protein